MNTISPGAVETGILSDFLSAFGERANAERPAVEADVAVAA